MSYLVTAGNRAAVLDNIIVMRCVLAVSFVVFLWRLGDHKEPVRVNLLLVPGWARKGIQDAFRFYRERINAKVFN